MRSSDLFTVLIFLCICGALAFFFREEVSKLVAMSSAPSNVQTGTQSPAVSEQFKALYSRLKVEPFGANLLADSGIAGALKDMTISFCDKTAIYRLSKGLAEKGERKPAATALLAFAAACPKADGERYLAANFLFGMGDYAAVVPIMDDLIERHPEIDQYYYVRAQALDALGRHDEAISDLNSALALVDDLKQVSSQLFTTLASAYAKAGQFCQAMTVIQTYLHADVAKRDTAATRKLISGYGEKGNCAQSYAQGTEVIPRPRPDVTIVRAKINGKQGNFLLDTGASLVALSPEFAAKANASTSDKGRRLVVHTANGVTNAELTTLSSVEIGKVKADMVSAAILSKPIGPGIDGLLGMSFLARFDVVLEAKAVRIQERTRKQSSN